MQSGRYNSRIWHPDFFLFVVFTIHNIPFSASSNRLCIRIVLDIARGDKAFSRICKLKKMQKVGYYINICLESNFKNSFCLRSTFKRLRSFVTVHLFIMCSIVIQFYRVYNFPLGMYSEINKNFLTQVKPKLTSRHSTWKTTC